jgi:hypothetical protein
MTQHELDAGLDVVPQGLAVSTRVYDKTLRAAEKIGKEVSKNMNGCFMGLRRIFFGWRRSLKLVSSSVKI